MDLPEAVAGLNRPVMVIGSAMGEYQISKSGVRYLFSGCLRVAQRIVDREQFVSRFLLVLHYL
jgi:hypothetical protein